MALNAEIIVSDIQDKSVSFPFNVSLVGEYIPEGRVFVSSREAITDNSFAIASAHRNTVCFRGLTPPTVLLDGELNVSNPLNGAAITKASLLGALPVVVIKDNPSSIFLVDDRDTEIAVYGAYGIRDAHEKKTTSILALTTNATEVFDPLNSMSHRTVFAAVSNKQGRFDGDGSGIAVLVFKKFESKKNKSFSAWDSIDAATGVSQFSDEGTLQDTGNKAFPFGKTTPQVFITNPVKTVESAVDMHFDRDLGILYIAVQVEASTGPTDGARALVLASCRNGKLQLQSIAPETAFADNTALVGGRGSGASISVYKVKTMQTRTYLRYLIGVGGNGNGTDLKRQVFALPIVDNLASSSHGALAKVTSSPVSLFSAGNPGRFLTRVFSEPAENPEDLYTSADVQARVGGAVRLPGAITDISVSAEAVFVSVEQADEELQPGIFYSQPLFDVEGRISAWANWQRVGGTSDPITAFVYDPYKATFTYIPVLKKGTTQTVLRTAFSEGKSFLESFISTEFPQQLGGVQSLFDFPYTSKSFSPIPGKRIAVQAYCGYKKLVLIQTGKDSSNLFGPVQRDVTVYTSTNGTLDQLSRDTALSLSGGVLDDLGPLSSCTVLTDGTFGWFIVGGAGGCAILADEQGRGWDASKGLEDQFKGLTAQMKWQKISESHHVRKLVASDNFLFILTDTRLLRLELSADTIKHKNFHEVTVAVCGSPDRKDARSFSDVIVSGPLALLATSSGILRSGDYVDIRTVSKDTDVSWISVALPESVGSLNSRGPVNRFFATSPTGDERDVTQGGTLWALNAYVGLNQALLYRFVVTLDQGSVTPTTLQLFPDYFFNTRKTFFVNGGEYRNYLVTDGAFIALSRSAFTGRSPLLEILPPLIKSGEAQGARNRYPLLVVQDRAFSIGKLVRNSASGAWMATGDFGVRVQA